MACDIFLPYLEVPKVMSGIGNAQENEWSPCNVIIYILIIFNNVKTLGVCLKTFFLARYFRLLKLTNVNKPGVYILGHGWMKSGYYLHILFPYVWLIDKTKKP